MTPVRAQTLALAIGVASAPALATEPSWPTLGGDNQRALTAPDIPALDNPRWIVSHDQSCQPIDWVGQSPPIIHQGRAYAIGFVGFDAKLFAIDLFDGAIDWAAYIDPPVLDSWSGPTADVANNRILIASGLTLEAFDANTGASDWIACLDRDVVNATPLVTDDRDKEDRAFITDYDGAGADGRLYCVNIDPYHASLNPFKPGDILWSAPIGGASGNSPSYADGAVYTAAVGEAFFAPGQILAFDAAQLGPADPSPLWTYTLPITQGFFGGLSLDGDDIYAVTYAFSGAQLAAKLVRLCASTGAETWTTPANRSVSIPIPIDDKRIALASGIDGFGSTPSIQLFKNDPTTPALILDTAGQLNVGGWTHHPVALTNTGAALLVTGEPTLAGASAFEPHQGLRVLNLEQAVTSAAFLDEASPHGGGSPAIADHCLVSVGATGLAAFGICGVSADLDDNDTINIEDLYEYEQSPTDLSGDGLIDNTDRELIERAVRGRDQRGLTP